MKKRTCAALLALAVLLAAATPALAQSQAPKSLTDKYPLFLRSWSGELTTEATDGSRHTWPLALEGRYILDSSGVMLEGRISFPGAAEVTWWHIITWDMMSQEVVHIELTGMGEVHKLTGGAPEGRSIDVTESRTLGKKQTAYSISIWFPKDGTMRWKTEWKEDGKVVATQELVARTEQSE